jgi:hypothetical protein
MNFRRPSQGRTCSCSYPGDGPGIRMGYELWNSLQAMDRSQLALLVFAALYVLACVAGLLRTVK